MIVFRLCAAGAPHFVVIRRQWRRTNWSASASNGQYGPTRLPCSCAGPNVLFLSRYLLGAPYSTLFNILLKNTSQYLPPVYSRMDGLDTRLFSKHRQNSTVKSISQSVPELVHTPIYIVPRQWQTPTYVARGVNRSVGLGMNRSRRTTERPRTCNTWY